MSNFGPDWGHETLKWKKNVFMKPTPSFYKGFFFLTIKNAWFDTKNKSSAYQDVYKIWQT